MARASRIGGAVSTDTVTAQLLYEVTGARYANPDVTARLDSVRLHADGPDRVHITGVTGEPPPPTLKVSLNSIGGFRNAMTFVLTGLDIDAKAALVRSQLEAALPVRPAELQWALARTDHPDAETEETASALLHCVARDPDPAAVGRRFSGAAVELALASYPGFHATTPPADGQVYGVFTPGYVDATAVPHVAVHADGSRVDIACAVDTLPLADAPEPELPTPLPHGPTRRAALGLVAGARSGDKGGAANVGVWVRSDDQWRWLVHFLTVETLGRLLPETAGLPVRRYLLPHHVETDIAEVVDDLNRHGYPFDLEWLAPFLEFRFPRIGTVQIGDVALSLRHAVEPWLVLGEEVTAVATSRYVDSSVERLQVDVTGTTPGRHVVTCNRIPVPLQPTGTAGRQVAGVRYRAWQPPSALHPTIGVHSPLVFDVVDTWSGRSLGGCTYHVVHPGGRSYDTFPVNANEAEARRASRFWAFGHSPGPLAVEPVTVGGGDDEYPGILDLRRHAPRPS